MIMEERRKQIADKLIYQRTLKVTSLMEEFNVSIETIRRDLEYLESAGFLKRVYGGAIRAESFSEEPLYGTREVKNLEAKKAIAQEAVSLLEDGDTVFVDIGTSCLEVAKLLHMKNQLTIITTSLMIAQEVMESSRHRVFVLGGELRKGDFSLSGFLTLGGLNNFNADKAIIGAGGITVNSGITDYHPEEATVRSKMIEHSKYSIVVADSSKFGVTAMSSVCTLDRVGVIVTDDNLQADLRATLEQNAIPYIISPNL